MIFFLLNWISVEFAPQIQNKQMVKNVYDSMNPTFIPKDVRLPD